jgi:hypothetical protein
MLGKRKLLLIIPAILLIPILLGMTPLKMGHKLASGGPFTHGKQICTNNHCPSHSLTSHHDPVIVILNLTLLDQESTPILDIHVLDSDPSHSNLLPCRVILRSFGDSLDPGMAFRRE